MVDVLRSQFAETFNDDDREPIVAFGIPYVDGEFSLYAPSAGLWKLLGLLSVIVTTLSIILACFIYKVIVERRGTIGSFLSGWGFVIPMSLYLPFYLLDALDLSNKILCLSTATLSCVCFRCIEAMYGTSPDVVESSIWNYCLYYSSPVRNGILYEQLISRTFISWKIHSSQYLLLVNANYGTILLREKR